MADTITTPYGWMSIAPSYQANQQWISQQSSAWSTPGNQQMSTQATPTAAAVPPVQATPVVTPVTPAIATAGNQAAQPVIKFGTWTALYGNTQNPNNVNPLTSTLAQQFQNKTLLDTYNAQINLPSKQAVQNQVYDQYGFRDKLDDIKAQQYALAKQITSPMTDIFSNPAYANNPWMAAAQVRLRMAQLGQSSDALSAMSDQLTAQASAMTDASYNQLVAENNKTDNAIKYMTALTNLSYRSPQMLQQLQMEPLQQSVSSIDKLWNTPQGNTLSEVLSNQMDPSISQDMRTQATQTIMQQAGINWDVNVNDLTQDQIDKVKTVQLKMSDPTTYNQLQSGGYITADGKIDTQKLSGASSWMGNTWGGALGTTWTPTIDTTTKGYFTSMVGNTQQTQASIDQQALNVALGWPKPSLGRASNPNDPTHLAYTAIMNREAELNSGWNIQANKAQLSSLNKTLTTQTGYVNTLQRSVDTADNTFQNLLNTFQWAWINDLDTPVLNMLNNAAKYNLGSWDVAAFQAGLTEVANDYQQVFSRGGTVTDSVRNTAHDIMSWNLSMNALQEVNQTLQQEWNTWISQSQKQISQIQNQINSIITPGKWTTQTNTTVAPTIPTVNTQANTNQNPTGIIGNIVWGTWSLGSLIQWGANGILDIVKGMMNQPSRIDQYKWRL